MQTENILKALESIKDNFSWDNINKQVETLSKAERDRLAALLDFAKTNTQLALQDANRRQQD